MGSENVRFGDISQNSDTELKEAGLRFFTVLYLPLHRQIHCFSNKISSVPFSYQHSAVFLVTLRTFHLAFLSEKLFKQQTYSSYLYQNTRFLLLWCCADAVGTYCCVNNLFFSSSYCSQSDKLIRISDKSGKQRYLVSVTAQTGEKGLFLRGIRVERAVTVRYIKCSLGGT